MSKTDSSEIFWARGKHNGSRRGQVTAYHAVREALAILVVTRSTCDHVKSEIKVTLQRVSFLSISIGNIVDNFRMGYYCK